MTAEIDLSLIGASDVPALLGVDPFVDPVDLYARIVHRRTPPRPQWLDDAGELGKLYEEGTARFFASRTMGGAPIFKPPSRARPGGLDGFRYSLDFVAGLEARGPSFRVVTKDQAVLECKMRNGRSFRSEGWGQRASDVPLRIAAQVQAQLAGIDLDRDYWRGTSVPELEHVDVLCVVDGQRPRAYRVDRDRELGAAILDRVASFYADHVLRRRVPTPGSFAAHRRLLRAMMQIHGKGSRPATADEEHLVEEYLRARDLRKLMEERLDELEAKLCEAIGQSHDRIDGSTFRVYWSMRRGLVRHRDVIAELARRLKLSKRELEDLEEAFRGEAGRDYFDVRRKKGANGNTESEREA